MTWPRFTVNEGETIFQRPNMVRCRYTLSNGQLLSVYFSREKVHNMQNADGTMSNRDIDHVWSVAIHIGKNRKEANKWFHSWRRLPCIQTGDCGLEGLAVAARYIVSFGRNWVRWRDEMQVGWADDKRMRAYKWLLRHKGFTLYESKDGKPECLSYRNPEFYEWIGQKPKGD